MQQAFVIAVAFAVTGCSIPYEMPHARDPESGQFECPMTRPIVYTVLAPVVGVLAGVEFHQGSYDAAHPMVDMNGLPTNSATLDRFAGAILAVAAGILTLTAIDSWRLRTRCTHLGEIEAENNAARAAGKPAQDQVLDPELEGLMKTAKHRAEAGDCGTVRTIAARVEKLDSDYYKDVFVPAVAPCRIDD
jgi:hypothetical protein